MGSSVFFVLAPGAVAVLVPAVLTDGWDSGNGYVWPIRAVGGVLAAAGAVVLVHSFVRFVVDGFGTPAPIAPPEHLVVGGLYRHVRNPMYVGVMSVVAGQALVLGRPVLWTWFGALAVIFGSFVALYEQPKLTRTFGEEYVQYCRAVPAWLPRLRPYRET